MIARRLIPALLLSALWACAPEKDRKPPPPVPAPVPAPAPAPAPPEPVPDRRPGPLEPAPQDVPISIDLQNYLAQAGLTDVVPMHELMRTASDWQRCGGPQYEVPPREVWLEMKEVLALVAELKRRGILRDVEAVSNYRNPRLNACAGGAPASSHTRAFAMDIVGRTALDIDERRLCQFWHKEGREWDMGLSRYPSGRIHIDTNGYRTWGASHGKGSSFCLPSSS